MGSRMVFEILEQFPAILGWHHHIQDDHLGRHLLRRAQRLPAAADTDQTKRTVGQVAAK
jgi:hypothetical protein